MVSFLVNVMKGPEGADEIRVRFLLHASSSKQECLALGLHVAPLFTWRHMNVVVECSVYANDRDILLPWLEMEPNVVTSSMGCRRLAICLDAVNLLVFPVPVQPLHSRRNLLLGCRTCTSREEPSPALPSHWCGPDFQMGRGAHEGTVKCFVQFPLRLSHAGVCA